MKLRRIDFYPDDFLVGVAGMTPEQIGVYWVINSLIYSSGGPIPEDDERIFRLVNCRPSKTKRIINDLKTCGKVFVNGSYLYCKRAVSEIETAQKRIKTAQENGAKNSNNNGLKTGVGHSLGNPPAPSPSPPPPTPPPEETYKAQAPAKKSTRIPCDWIPSEKDLEHAKTRGLDEQTISAVAEQFRDHWTAKSGKDAACLDWSARWRTWTKNHIGWHGTGTWPENGARKPNGNGREPESVIAIGARIVARHKANNGFRGNGSGGVETPADGSNDLDDTGIIDGTEFGYDTSDNG